MVSSLGVTITPSRQDMIIIGGLHLGEKGASKVIEEAGEFYPLLKTVLKRELAEIAKTPRSK